MSVPIERPQETLSAISGNRLSGENNYRVEVKSETSEEQTARLKREGRESGFKLIKEAFLLVFAVVVTVLIGLACFVIILTQSYSQRVEDWAMGIVLLIAGGVVGYVTGKSSNPKDK